MWNFHSRDVSNCNIYPADSFCSHHAILSVDSIDFALARFSRVIWLVLSNLIVLSN